MDYKGAKGTGSDRVATYNELGGGGGSSVLAINPRTASYTLVLTDVNTDVQMSVATANNITFPPNSSVPMAIGAQGIVTQTNTGQTTITAGAGVTINYPTGFSLGMRAQNSQITWEKTGTDTFFVSGDLTITGVQTVSTPSFGDNSTQVVNTAYVNALLTVKSLASDASPNSTTTLAGITGLDTTVGPGTYTFKYIIRYQSGATTTGVKFSVTHSGTVTCFMYQLMYVDATATASTAAASQNQTAGAAATVIGAWSTRAKGTAIGPTISVDAANSDMQAIIEGLMVVSVSGSLQLSHASEVAAASTVKAGTSLILIRTA